MALVRSSTGPAGLSINTSSANSLFGNTTTPAPTAAGMFGSTQAASKPLFGAATTTTAPTTGGLFGSTAAPAQPQTGGLFGNAPAQPQTGGLFGNTTAQPQTGGLFGNAPAQTQTGGLFGNSTAQPQTTGLFGSTAASAQPQTGGLFGNATTTQAPSGGLFGAAQPSTGGLFGSTATSQAPSNSLFGGLNTNQNQTGAGGLFGGSSTQQTGGGLFGAQNQAKPAGSSLFGGLGGSQNTNQQPQPSFAGGLTMGQGNQPQVIPGVRIDTANIRGTTRFSDLQIDIQAQIEQMDKSIFAQIEQSNQCAAIMLKHDDQVKQIPDDVEFCRRKLLGVENAQSADVEAIAKASVLVKSDRDNAMLSFQVIDNLKLPQQFHVHDSWQSASTSRQANGAEESSKVVGFVSATADELSSTLTKYQNNISEIEHHLRSVEVDSAQQINALISRRNGSTRVDDDTVRDLAAALGEFEQSILHVAGKVGAARESVQTLQLGGFTNGRATNGNGKRSGVY